VLERGMEMEKVFILNVGKQLNVTKPLNNWLTKDHLESESDCENVVYHLFKKDDGKYFIASSWGADNCDEEQVLIASQSHRELGFGKIVLRFKCKDINQFASQIKEITGKNSLPFYVYK
jgi:hypothetical protein